MGSRAGGGKQIGGWHHCKGFDLVFALTIIYFALTIIY